MHLYLMALTVAVVGIVAITLRSRREPRVWSVWFLTPKFAWVALALLGTWAVLELTPIGADSVHYRGPEPDPFAVRLLASLAWWAFLLALARASRVGFRMDGERNDGPILLGLTFPLLPGELSSTVRTFEFSAILCAMNFINDALAQTRARNAEVEMRTQLLGRISHNLRTPAAAIRSLVDALEGRAVEDPAERDRFLALIRAEAERLGTGLDRMLRAARGEDVPTVKRIAMDLGEWSRAVYDRWKTRLPGLRLEAGPGLAAHADPEHLDEAVDALLDNSMRYGGPNVVLAASAGGDTATIAVSDDGAGTGQPARPGGTGLGLAAVRGVARAHGGDLAIEAGKRFVITFPARTTA